MFTLKDDSRLLPLYRFFYSKGLVSQTSAEITYNTFPGAAAKGPENATKCVGV